MKRFSPWDRLKPVLRVLALLALGGVRSAAQGQPPAANADLSLAGAVAKALDLNPNLAAVREDLPAALARLRMARAEGRLAGSANAFLTTGNMGEMLTGADQVTPQMMMDLPNKPNADLDAMFSYPLYTGGRVGSRVAAADAKVRATKGDIDTMVLEVAYTVRKAYWQVLLNLEMVKVQEENVTEQQERLRVDQASFDAGKTPWYYVQRDKAELAAAQQGLTNAQRDVGTSLLDLRAAIGLPLTTPLQLTDKLTYDPAAVDVDEEALVKSALAARPEARALTADLEAARRETKARRAAFQPQVDGMLILDSQAMSGKAEAGYLGGIVASLPVFDGGSRRANVSEAEAMARQTEKRLAALRLEIERQVRAAVLLLHAANQNVRTATEAVAAAEEDYRIALAKYQAGKAINLEPITALAALVQARTSLAQALLDFNVAIDAVRKATGALPG